MWHRIVDVKLLVTMAVALLIVAALACGKDEAAPAAPAQAAKAALPAVQAEPDAPAGTVAGPGAPQAPERPQAGRAAAQPQAPDAPRGATGVTQQPAAPRAGRAPADPDAPQAPAAATGPTAGAGPTGPAMRTGPETRAMSVLSPTGTKMGTYESPKQFPGEVFMPALYDGPMPSTWQENPRFAAAAASGANWGQAEGHYGNHEGALPGLDGRVPIVADRLVHQVPDEIGAYGGIWRMANSGWQIDMRTLSLAGVVKWGNDGVTMTPYILKDWRFEDGGRKMVGTLRQGLKWSDGTDLDMENIRFAHDDIMNNREYRTSPVFPCVDLVTGNTCTVDYIDDWNYSYTFDTPNFIIMEGEGAAASHYQCRGTCIYASDYLKQFHPGYADPATLNSLMAAADISDWPSHFRTRVSVHGAWYRLQPVVGAWVQTSGVSVGDHLYSEANPFYHVFDPEGNQMPYLDGTASVGFESREVAVFRAMAGESDGHTQIYRTDELPLYQANMVSGDYSIYPWPDMAGSDSWFRTNQTYNDDPDIGRALRTKDFRIALSLAIDREEVNELVFLSLGSPGNMIPNPVTPYSPGEVPYRNVDAVRDVTRANALLDGLGYTDSDSNGTRNFPGGSDIELFLEINSDRWYTLGDILVSNFADIGITLDWRADDNSATHWNDNTNYFGVGGGHGNPNPFHAYPTGTVHGPGLVAPLIDLSLRTQGAEGMAKTGSDPAYQPLAPAGTWPADSDGVLSQLGETLTAGQNFELLHPTRVVEGKKYFQLGAESKYNIGLVHFAPAFRGIMLKRNNFRNVVKHQNWDAIGFSMYQTYFEDGKDNMNNRGNKSTKYSSESFLTGLTYD